MNVQLFIIIFETTNFAKINKILLVCCYDDIFMFKYGYYFTLLTFMKVAKTHFYSLVK